MFEGLLNQGCWVSFGCLSNIKTVYLCGVRVGVGDGIPR